MRSYWLRVFSAWLSLSFILSVHLQGQTNYIPKIIPPSPNASTLLKFIDVPVSPYTGTSDVTIPIYTIQLKGATVPISLNYHTGGIRIKEESGWVGLGWALSAGGSISRTIIGKDDFDGISYFNASLPQLQGDLLGVQPAQSNGQANFGKYFFDFYCNYNVAVTSGTMDFTNAFTSGTNNYDVEPDIYNYSFGGRSGKFMITRDRKVILQKQDNIRVQFENNGNSFTITDDQGNKYFFADKEYTQSATSVPPASISSWNLSKIITQQQDSLTLTYITDSTWSYTAPDYYEIYMSSNDCATQGLSVNNGPGNTYLNKTLQKIDFPSGQLQFSFDGKRSDLQSGKKLNSIKLYSKVSSQLNYLKEFDLSYSYYDGPTTGVDSLEKKRLRLDSVKEISGSLVIPPYTFTYNLPQGGASIFKHGHSVDHWGFFNSVTNITFIPSQSIYFLAPAQGAAPGFLNYSGANREADASPTATYTSAFSLQQVKYPTGGKTVFTYEPNDYDAQKSIVAPVDFPFSNLVTVQKNVAISNPGNTIDSIDLSHLFPINSGGVTSTNLLLLVNFRGSSLDSLHNAQPGKISFTITGANMNQTVDITNGSVICDAVCHITIPLSISAAPSLMYTYTGHIDPSVANSIFEGIHITFQYNEIETVLNNNPTSIAGGLRVKGITDFNSDNQIAKQRSYEYNYVSDGSGGVPAGKYSYGKLMSQLSYARYIVIYTVGGTCMPVNLFGSSVSSLTSTTQGNIVGYSQVTEYTGDPGSGQNLGKTVYKYYNSPDTPIAYAGHGFPGVLNISNNLSGLLLSKTDYSFTGVYYKKVADNFHDYHATNRIIYFSPKYQYTTNITSGAGCSPSNLWVSVETLATFYPTLKSERVLEDSSTNILFDQMDTTKWIKTIQKNNYDNAAHYQLTRTTTTDSRNNQHISYLKYPQDYLIGANQWTGNTIVDSLIGRNMVSTVVEKRDSLYLNGSLTGGAITSASVSRYRALSSNSLGMDKQFKLDLRGPIVNFQPFSFTGNTLSQDARYRQMISFDSYDLNNNLQQFTATDQTPNSFIWDYENVYPIAQVKNAVVADIAFTSFEADGKGNWTFTSSTRDTVNFLTGKKSYNLSQGAISKSGLTIGKIYIVSFWSKSATFTITGGTSTTTTGRSSGPWTYKENKVTATATTITITGSGDIDELRLYPLGTQMTSYTYQPLTGISTANDPNSEITFYEYDSLQRLKNVKDYLGNIIKNYQYNYAQGCTACALPMKTFAGTLTISYPVGVFSAANKLLGNATTPAQYMSLWNADAANHVIGTLATGLDSMHFVLTLNTGQVSPGFVIGCRYYQFDLPYTNFDATYNNNGAYIDFGDGTGMRYGLNHGDSNVLKAAFTVTNVQSGSDGIYIYWIHSYPDASSKTLTFYHNDGTEGMNLDNAFSPATSLSLLRNFRGNLPQNTQILESNCFQQAGANTVSLISNWSSINSINRFYLYSGDHLNPCLHVNFAQDFMANNKNLQIIATDLYGYYDMGNGDSTFKISRLKSNWNTYFTNLTTLEICDADWNREDISALSNLNFVQITAGTQNHTNSHTSNPLVPIPTSAIDNIINQLATPTYPHVSNGFLNILSGGTNRSSSSDNGLSVLKAKGWTIVVNSVIL